ncbi:hypothetical protein V5N11_026448 [Cardamine amara subsp. amara]|uniref:CTP synthase N-terminal domain-containing protein n=1 Tax=Cardamine amara subsp. amara TaxID=228776 RepID=A0ABD1B3Y3_CARAN
MNSIFIYSLRLQHRGFQKLDCGLLSYRLSLAHEEINNRLKLPPVTEASRFQAEHVLEKERKGDYLGKIVQVVPHITDAIQEWIERAARIPVDGQSGPADVCVIELRGTIGILIYFSS